MNKKERLERVEGIKYLENKILDLEEGFAKKEAQRITNGMKMTYWLTYCPIVGYIMRRENESSK